jgi:hypothetical protein
MRTGKAGKLSVHLRAARLVLGQRSTESPELTVGFQSTEACHRLQHAGRSPSQSHRHIAPALHVPCYAADRACMFSIALVQASERRSSGGRRSRLIVTAPVRAPGMPATAQVLDIGSHHACSGLWASNAAPPISTSIGTSPRRDATLVTGGHEVRLRVLTVLVRSCEISTVGMAGLMAITS